MQPTKTPRVLFRGIAKHFVPLGHTLVITKFPSVLQFPTFPAMHAICPDVHGEEKFSVAKRLLYPCASAKLALKSADETVAVAVGAD